MKMILNDEKNLFNELEGESMNNSQSNVINPDVAKELALAILEYCKILDINI